MTDLATSVRPTEQDVDRRMRAGRAVRREAAHRDYPETPPAHPTNGEERDYPYLASYSKGLPHNDLGEVDRAAYHALLRAVRTGRPRDFEEIPLARPDARKLLGPQGGLALDLMGPDSHTLVVPPAPRMDGPQAAAEMAELYWMALLREVRFTEFETSPLAAAAAADLSTYSGYQGPKEGGTVTPRTLFRGDTPADRVGPFVSQFLLQPVQYGCSRIEQRIDTVEPGVDYGTTFDEWLAIQRGAPRQTRRDFVNTRYIQTPRDLGHYTHFDVLYQPYLYAALILLGRPDHPVGVQDPGNPYLRSANQVGFPTFGTPHLITALAEVSLRAIKHTEFQQFFVHRRLRPEAFGGRVEVQLARDPHRYDEIIHRDILESEAVDRTRTRYGTALLPQGFPEGSPMSPAYQSGHSTVAGACVTVLKAWFDERAAILDPVVPSADGTRLVPYTGSDADRMTVGGELNKLAANIGAGRATAGVHYRTDNTEAYELGETIAIRMLRQQKPTFLEDGGFTLTRFDGTTVTI
ncbi:vanadium-dependent haloperoxidase [Actinophytocola xanthii]|uniref:Phosphoesterase n=1 Tax=Actinophytocola xanthii TaxID=1912961 RepID=A0A1Q8CSD4_9PSEU|nr:vanadium-dependent haloperoxidase [Actinophytocola xanthii]OLF17253.1 phosphoesterase [Actinophytocola xanthii]